MPALLDLEHPKHAAIYQDDVEDATAELIVSLSQHEANLLWATLIQLKPHLRD